MNFIKTFLITLVIYIGLNAVFLVASIFLSPGYPLDDIFLVVSSLFSPIIRTPQYIFMSFVFLPMAPDLLIGILSILAIIVPPLVAVIVGARLGDSGKISFLSWFLTALLSSVVYFFLVFFGKDISSYFSSMWLSYEMIYGFIGAIVILLMGGIINGFFYGCFSFLFSRD
ncbi:MAG: hypothetical protein ACFE8G_10480 [Candidatus Hermodarchaeota archaeon]